MGVRAVRTTDRHHRRSFLNSFFLLRPNGVIFTAPAGTAEFAKRWNPKAGDIVSFKHRGFLAGSMKPKFPGLFRVREDITWEDVVNNWKEKKPRTAGTSVAFAKLGYFVAKAAIFFLFSFYAKKCCRSL